MSASFVTFLFETANFLVLAGGLGWLFFDPVRKSLEQRRLELVSETNEAAQRLSDASKRQSEIQLRQAELQRELDLQRDRAKSDAEEEAKQIRSQASAAADRERDRLRHELASLQDSHLEDLSKAVASATADIVRHLLERIAGPDLNQALIRAACDELDQLGQAPLLPVHVETACTLTEHDREQLLRSLGNAAASSVISVAPSLGGGIRISTDQGLIDASLSGLSAFARRAVLNQFEQPVRLVTTDESIFPISEVSGNGDHHE